MEWIRRVEKDESACISVVINSRSIMKLKSCIVLMTVKLRMCSGAARMVGIGFVTTIVRPEISKAIMGKNRQRKQRKLYVRQSSKFNYLLRGKSSNSQNQIILLQSAVQDFRPIVHQPIIHPSVLACLPEMELATFDQKPRALHIRQKQKYSFLHSRKSYRRETRPDKRATIGTTIESSPRVERSSRPPLILASFLQPSFHGSNSLSGSKMPPFVLLPIFLSLSHQTPFHICMKKKRLIEDAW
ncbi:hypothetical protein VTL71DRAFT_10467 [Oculimacula yallundae]|uniref:Uncharacterized protein n=1 Tax=Oculimacula yallundae TaxID=86028 RepID=A0ABR4CT39_9HELO